MQGGQFEIINFTAKWETLVSKRILHDMKQLSFKKSVNSLLSLSTSLFLSPVDLWPRFPKLKLNEHTVRMTFPRLLQLYCQVLPLHIQSYCNFTSTFLSSNIASRSIEFGIDLKSNQFTEWDFSGGVSYLPVIQKISSSYYNNSLKCLSVFDFRP